LVIDIMEEQKKVTDKGGTMRLGAYPCVLAPDSLISQLYGTNEISERHRHRYEFNPEYRQRLEREGLVFSGVSPDGKFVEMIELPREVHPWFVGCQFHPEYKSKPLNAHPLFASFVRAAYENRLQSETSMEKNGEVDLVMHERVTATSGD
jgi:CTP synthase